MRTLAVLISVVVLTACGDDEDEGRPRYRSGVQVQTSTPVEDLEDEDLRRICASLDAHVQANVDFDIVSYAACLPGAILTSANETQCEQELDRCIASGPDPLVINARLEDESVCFSSLRACNASVADLETCININFDIVYDLFDSLSCGGVSDQEAQAAAQRAMDVNVCADVSAACNQFADIVGPD
jgi:hypothetical protein